MHSRNLDPNAGWVRVEDAMPEDEREVIVATSDGNQHFAHRYDGKWRDQKIICVLRLVTHWRSRFKPPKEGE